MAKKRIIAVDLGTSSVKVAEVALSSNGFRVTRVGSADVDSLSDNPQAETRALKKAMSNAGIRRGECVVSVPRHQIVTRRLSSLPPKLEGERLADVVRMQAEVELPFPSGEAIYDFYDVRHTDSGTSVDLLAAKRVYIEALVERVREAGLKPTLIAPSVFGTAALARLHQRAHSYQKRLMILNVGNSNTDVVVMRGDYFAFSRSFPVGAESFRLAPDEAIPRFRAELRRTLQSYQREFMENGKDSIEEVWIWGGGATSVFQADENKEVALTELLEAELNAPARIWSEASGFADASIVEKVPQGWARLGLAIGLAVGALEQSLGVNLIPGEIQARKVQAARGRQLLLGAIAFAALMTAIVVTSSAVERRIRTSLNHLRQEIEEIRVPVAAATQTLGEMRTLAEMTRPRYSVLDILRELTALLPERTEVAVTVLSIEKTGKITVNLEAISHDAASQAIKKIGESAWFTNVLPGQISTVQKENRQIRQLSVTFRLAPDADVLAARLMGTPVSEIAAPLAQAGPPGGEGPRERGQGPPGGFGGSGGFPPGGFQLGPIPPAGWDREGTPNIQPAGPRIFAPERQKVLPEAGDALAPVPPKAPGREEIRVYRIENDEPPR